MVEMLTPQDVSRITGLSLETLAQWRSKKIHLPYLKIGRLIRYDRRDVEAYLEACKVIVSHSHRRQK
jgi:excisionase family DNA binding protein